MNSQLEIEYKMMLDETQFRKLKSFYEEKGIKQLNVYYDFIPSVREKGISFRIRTKEDKHLFTLKKKHPLGNEEYEFEVRSNSIESLGEDKVSEVFHKFALSGELIETGRLLTERTEIELMYGHLCLDENEYYDIKDYELEYELKPGVDSDKANKEFYELFEKFKLTFKANKATKLARCLNNYHP